MNYSFVGTIMPPHRKNPTGALLVLCCLISFAIDNNSYHIQHSTTINVEVKAMSSFASQILSPGGGVLLIPFIKMVIMVLFCTTFIAFCFGIARIHMAILSFLAGGLLLAIRFFMSEYEKALTNAKQKARSTGATVTTSSNGERAKSD